MNMWVDFLVSFITGITASLGLGGGFILLVYLTAFSEVLQIEAQGINLVFFIPIAALSLFIHGKNGLLEKKVILPCVAFGIIGAIAGVYLAGFIGNRILNKIFAVFVLIIGLKELFHKKKEK